MNNLDYYLILNIFSFLLKNKCKKQIPLNLKLVNKYINIFFINECNIFCKYNNTAWCKHHEKPEYLLSNMIYSHKKNKFNPELISIMDINLIDNNLSFHHENLSHSRLKDVYNRVVQNDTSIKFSHYCCGGKGIMFYSN